VEWGLGWEAAIQAAASQFRGLPSPGTSVRPEGFALRMVNGVRLWCSSTSAKHEAKWV